MSPLREGYTTGSCAAAAALASCLWRKTGECPKQVEITLRDGRTYRPAIIAHTYPVCGVLKDAGDDPDITNGMEVLAQADVLDEEGKVVFFAGEGIGIVTQPGLKIAVGEPAINPVPRQMVREVVRNVYPDRAVNVTISIPGGEAVSARTFNPRLGVQGGLSILGTTGIVRPMSDDAVRETVALQIQMHRAKGETGLTLAFGNQGEEAIVQWKPSHAGHIVQMSNYVGFALDTLRIQGFGHALIAGHPGKMAKLAAGIMQTKNSVADARKEPILAQLALMGADMELLLSVDRCLTTEAMLPLIERGGFIGVWERLADRAQAYCEARVQRKIKIDIVFLTGGEKALGVSARLREDENAWREK